jgi:hypothetical protein
MSQRFGTGCVEVDAGIGKNLCGNSLLFAQETEQQMPPSQRSVRQVASLGHRALEHLLGARGIWKVRSGRCRCLTLLYRVLDLLLNLIESTLRF